MISTDFEPIAERFRANEDSVVKLMTFDAVVLETVSSRPEELTTDLEQRGINRAAQGGP